MVSLFFSLLIFIFLRIRRGSEKLSIDFGTLAEEKICLEVADQAESFLSKVKKVMQVRCLIVLVIVTIENIDRAKRSNKELH